MRLERVEVFGFKSFPQKVELCFDEGITALVGPNGCGKTNIVEAVRWVLGEQNAHLLRCERMEDLIFNGTRSRKPLGVAEVTITLLNDGALPLDFSETAITRRLYRSGDSEYLINKRPCRLRDIAELFMDTGLGAGSYSFFEQKQIDQILSSDPASRRSFFEEASEIAKYRRRKRESLRRLEVAQADLLRLEDIIDEVDKTARSLKRQARRAEKYLSLKEELRESEITLAKAKVEEISREAKLLRESISSREAEKDEKRKALLSLEGSLNEEKSWLSKEEEESSRRRAKLESLTSEIGELSDEILVSKERRRFLQDEEKRLRDEVEAMEEEKLPSAEKSLEEHKLELNRLEGSVGEGKKEIEGKVEELKRFEEKVLNKRIVLGKKEEALAEQIRKRDGVEKDRISLKARLEANEGRGAALRDEVDDNVAGREEVGGFLVQRRKELVELDGVLAGEEVRGKSLTKEVEEKKKWVEELSKELGLRDRELHRSRSELEILSSHRETLEGYLSGVKYLVEREGVEVVAELIDFEPEYWKAVEGVLSFKSQAAVVASWEDALRLISLAKDKGQVALLPLDLMQPRDPPEPPMTAGVLGVLGDFVKCEGSFSPILDVLIGGYLLVEDLKTALRLSREEAFGGWGLVTLEGEVVEPSRAITGGIARGGVIERRGRLRELGEAVSGLEVQVEEKRKEREIESERLSGLVSKVEEFRGEVGRLVEKKTKLGLELSRLNYDNETIDSAMKRLEREQSLLEHTVGLDREEMEAREEELIRLEKEVGRRKREIEELEEELRKGEKGLDELSRDIDRRQVELLRDEDRFKGLKAQVEREELDRGELRSLIEGKEREISRVQAEISSLEESLGNGESRLRELSSNREEFVKAGEDSDGRRREVHLRVSALEEEVRGVRGELEGLEQPFQSLRIDLLKLEMEEGALRKRISTDYGVELDTVSPRETLPDNLEKEIEELKASVSRLEPVNLTAFEEFKQTEERLNFLRSQRLDLVEAKETLEKTLSALDRKAKVKFTETFEEVRGNFKSIFTELFGEGEADLLLQKGRDPLEAEITIYAKPPGKKLERIELLSAGERSLLAIALLFSIYLTRPSPFCILDELDAALDDANVGRFISLIRRLSQDSQLVLVTHNRRTMDIADYLYGVTMEELGVSSIVSVKVE